MKVLVVAEEAHEREGALPALIRRLNPAIKDVECEYANAAKVRAFRGKGDGFYKRALRWLIEAENRGHDALIFLIDRDGHKNRSQQMDKAQDNIEGTMLPRAMGVAVEAFDAWILADPRALSKVLGCNVQQQPDPETIKAQTAKARCVELLGESQSGLRPREMYAEVLQTADLETLGKRCKRGFQPFAERVSNLSSESAE